MPKDNIDFNLRTRRKNNKNYNNLLQGSQYAQFT